MKQFLASLCFLGSLIHALALHAAPASEFQLEGDYLIGGLFNIHHVDATLLFDKPEAIDCSGKRLIKSNYRKFQVMRFAVEEINNSTNLLPNVSLGYDIFDHCSDTRNFPDILNFISANGSIQPWSEAYENVSKVVAVIGAFTSTQTLAAAPLIMMNLIPMVSYGASSSVFSRKQNFPSFLRTVHPNKDSIKMIVQILQHFNWRWVAFLNIDDDYGNDGLTLFIQSIKDTEICLAYTRGLHNNTNYPSLFKQIEKQNIHVIIVHAPEWTVEPLIKAAIQLNITNKVWVAGEAWSLNKKLPNQTGIRNIGTIIGAAEQIVKIPGFRDFIYSSKRQNHQENAGQQTFCNQGCNCNNLTAENIFAAESTYSFSVYSAVYAVAKALHNTLQCGSGECNRNIAVYPHMVAAELKKLKFKLSNQTIQFDENGDIMHVSFSIVFWNQSGVAEEVGYFCPLRSLFINSSKIQWHTSNGTQEVPTSLCSPECPVGHKKKQDGIYKCCFNCEICPIGTYINSTEDSYNCIRCKDTEWSTEGSTSCNLRVVEYVSFTDIGALLIMVGTVALVGLSLAVSVLFAINYNTPVVRSAGGPMCFLILGCIILSSGSVFFYFGKPTLSFCILRFLPFVLFYTVCLACFVVRSFQVVFIFKMAAKFRNFHSWWMKYHGKWLVIPVAFVTQALCLVFGYSFGPPKLYNETSWYPDKIILRCDFNIQVASGSLVLLSALCILCFIFSYMGKDLPKNYNEAKAITFCLFLLILTWTIFATTYLLHRGKYSPALCALAVLSSLYSFLLFYFLPKCYIIIFQSYKNTQQYFQGLIQNYTKIN